MTIEKLLIPGTPDYVLEQAKGIFDYAVVIGWDSDGGAVLMTSEMTVTDANYLIDMGKKILLEDVDE